MHINTKHALYLGETAMGRRLLDAAVTPGSKQNHLCKEMTNLFVW